MVNCPKCNFTQPKDQFCANCGVDMLTYRPAQPPLAVQIAKNWVVQLSVIAVILIVGVILMRAKNRAQFVESFAALEQVTSRQKNFLSKKPVEKKIAENLDVAKKAPAAAPPPPEAKLPEPVAVVAPVVKNEPAPAADSANPFPTKLRLVFAEVGRAGLASLMGDSRNVASFGTYVSGMLPDQNEKTRGLGIPGIMILDSANDLQIKPNQPIVVFKGSRDPQLEQNIGLTAQITPGFIDEQGAHLQIEVKRTLRAPAGVPGPPITEETFQEQMILKKDGRGYMSGLLPHRVLNDEESRLLSSNPTILKVLATPDFQANNSEFVLFIEAR